MEHGDCHEKRPMLLKSIQQFGLRVIRNRDARPDDDFHALRPRLPRCRRTCAGSGSGGNDRQWM